MPKCPPTAGMFLHLYKLSVGLGKPSECFFADDNIREPVTHWECSDEKIAAIKDGFCQREQLAFVQCYSAAVAP